MNSVLADLVPAEHATLDLAGERLLLRADHSVYWPATNTLLVADTHFGKAGVFRRRGMGLPAGTSDADLTRLGAAIADTGARRVIVLGDFVHAPPGDDEPWSARFVDWRARHADVEIVVTRGNHDRADRLPDCFDIVWHAGRCFEAPFVFMHEPGADPRGPTLAGHLHPVVRLVAGRERLRAPVFWRTAHGLVLPAFCSFAGGARIAATAADRVFAIGDGAVVEVGFEAGPAASR